jgi:hypothetical protein
MASPAARERPGLTIEEAALAASELAALGGRGHDEAVAVLEAMAGSGAARVVSKPVPRTGGSAR